MSPFYLEGVDRNVSKADFNTKNTEVALHSEGVDRNGISWYKKAMNTPSPFTWRVWIKKKKPRRCYQHRRGYPANRVDNMP